MTRPSDAAIYLTVVFRAIDPESVRDILKRTEVVAMSRSHAIRERDAFEAIAQARSRAIDAEAKDVAAVEGVASEEWKRIPAKLTKAMSDAGKHAMKGTADELSERTRAEIVFWAMVASAPTAVEGRS